MKIHKKQKNKSTYRHVQPSREKKKETKRKKNFEWPPLRCRIFSEKKSTRSRIVDHISFIGLDVWKLWPCMHNLDFHFFFFSTSLPLQKLFHLLNSIAWSLHWVTFDLIRGVDLVVVLSLWCRCQKKKTCISIYYRVRLISKKVDLCKRFLFNVL